MNRLVELLIHPDKSVAAPALRAVGNVLTGDDVQTQVHMYMYIYIHVYVYMSLINMYIYIHVHVYVHVSH